MPALLLLLLLLLGTARLLLLAAAAAHAIWLRNSCAAAFAAAALSPAAAIWPTYSLRLRLRASADCFFATAAAGGCRSVPECGGAFGAVGFMRGVPGIICGMPGGRHGSSSFTGAGVGSVSGHEVPRGGILGGGILGGGILGPGLLMPATAVDQGDRLSQKNEGCICVIS